MFASSREVVGRSVFLNGIEFKLIGVTPEKFTGLDNFFRPALYVPLAMSARLAGNSNHNWMDDRADRRLDVRGRLASWAS